MNIVTRLALGLAACCVLLPALAVEDEQGCKDHPLLKRMPGYGITRCSVKQFDARDFAAGPVVDTEGRPQKVQRVEGAQTALAYSWQGSGAQPSALQIARNYANAIKGAGGAAVAEFPEENSGKGLADPEWGIGDRAAVYRINRAGKEFWVQVHPINEGGMYLLYVGERGAMSQDVAVNEIASQIAKAGFISLYINFDTGKSTIKSDSFGQLDKVVDALKQSSQLKIEVGGHTDNVGTADANLALSDARAKAVMKYLTDKGIAAARLTAKGYGQTQPIADNRTEDGRAKNRRVDLVKKS